MSWISLKSPVNPRGATYSCSKATNNSKKLTIILRRALSLTLVKHLAGKKKKNRKALKL